MVRYLGYVVSNRGVETDKEKMQVMMVVWVLLSQNHKGAEQDKCNNVPQEKKCQYYSGATTILSIYFYVHTCSHCTCSVHT